MKGGENFRVRLEFSYSGGNKSNTADRNIILYELSGEKVAKFCKNVG